MASAATVFSVIALIIVILVGGAVALLFLYPGLTHGAGSATSSSSITTAYSTSSTTSSPSSSLQITTTTINHATTTTSSNSSTSSGPCLSNCSLQLVSGGLGQLLNSSLTTPLPLTNFPGDGPCCSFPNNFADTINYSDGGNLWILQGDIEPMGGATAEANASGLTLSYQTCPTRGNLTACTPHHELWGDNESFDDSGIYGDLGAIPILPSGQKDAPNFGRGPIFAPALSSVPNTAQVFSISVNLPYHSYFSTCSQDTGHGGKGCTYEISPYDSATFGYDVGGNYDVVSVAEICTNLPCGSVALQMLAYTSSGGSSVDTVLNTTVVQNYTPDHRLTIATDRKTYVDLYVDNNLLYSSSKLPIFQNSSGSGALEFSTHTSINNETDDVTFANVSAYASPYIAVTGLSSGMSATVNGSDGFVSSSNANSSGMALILVPTQPNELSVSVNYNGRVIATTSSNVTIGSVLKLSPP